LGLRLRPFLAFRLFAAGQANINLAVRVLKEAARRYPDPGAFLEMLASRAPPVPFFPSRADHFQNSDHLRCGPRRIWIKKEMYSELISYGYSNKIAKVHIP
jgi:hypothetical protein